MIQEEYLNEIIRLLKNITDLNKLKIIYTVIKRIEK